MNHPGFPKLAWPLVLLICLLWAAETPAETGFGLPIEGQKTVTLSNKVGKNQITFTSTAPLEEIEGTASGISGSLTLDPNHLETLSGAIKVDVLSMETGIKRRDRHLYSKDWLDADAHPEITFSVNGLQDLKLAENTSGKVTVKGTAAGAFSLHGVTEEMQIPFEATYIPTSEQTQKRAPGDFVMVRATFQIALKAFNIAGVRGIVGSKVGEVIDVQATFFGSTAIK